MDRKENEVAKVTSIPDGSYVRMLDANGNSVQIDKVSFIEAVRDALPEATVEKKGLMSFADKDTGLFSKSAAIKDFDVLFNAGIFFVGNNFINYPIGGVVYGVLLVFGYGQSYVVQLYYDTSRTVFRRIYCNSTWGAWTKV